jgi:hypothetical protein
MNILMSLNNERMKDIFLIPIRYECLNFIHDIVFGDSEQVLPNEWPEY